MIETRYSAGNDDSGQIIGAPTGYASYILIAAGNATGAALTSDGHIVTWGQTLAGVPTDAGYTDLSLVGTTGFTIKEQGIQLNLNGPISPGQRVNNSDGVTMTLPSSIDLEHTHNFVTRVFDPATGKELFWTNDRNVTRAILPNGGQLPVSIIHYVNSSSDVNGTVDYQTTVSSPGKSGATWVNVSEDHWHKATDTMLPRAVCYADTGCSAGVVADHQVFLSKPVNVSTGAIPVFSVHQLSDNSWVGTLGILGSSNAADTTTIQMEKNNVDPNQPINFTVNSANLGASGTNMFVTAQANLTNQSSILYYTITGTASVTLPEMNITPQIWEKNTTVGDVLVYTGDMVNCSAGTSCVVTGDYPASDAAEYFVNATIQYTLFESSAKNSGVLNILEIIPMSTPYTKTTTTYYTFAEAITDYSKTSYGDLVNTVNDSKGFKEQVNGDTDDTSIKWANYQFNTNNGAKSNHWNRISSSNEIQNAEFVYFSGHGDTGKIRFGTQEGSYELDQSNIGPYTSSNDKKVKWIVFSSCYTMNQSAKDNWGNTFDSNNVHMLLGSDTFLKDYNYGEQFGKRMKGASNYEKSTIFDAWEKTVKNVEADSNEKGAILYDDNCKSDYLSGYGTSCSSRKGTRTYYSFKAG